MQTNTLRNWLVATLVVVALAGCSSKGQTAAEPLPSGTVREGTVTATARVKAIDHQTRKVTLERPDGSLIKFRASDAVRNLPQVKVGDQVTAIFHESVAFQVVKAGEATMGAAVAGEVARSEAGERPAIAGATVTKVTTKITGIDKQADTVTLQDADGETVTIKVRHPENLERVAVGDLVEITLTEAVAIAVEAATP
jgi:Cu/Ag efflux protein CusF